MILFSSWIFLKRLASFKHFLKDPTEVEDRSICCWIYPGQVGLPFLANDLTNNHLPK